MGDKKKDKTKKVAKTEVKAGKAEAAVTADKPKAKKEKIIEKPDPKRLEENNAAMAKVSPAAPKPEKRPTIGNLPEHVTKHRVTGHSTVSEGVVKIAIDEITGTSKSMYVNDIHAAVPTVLETHYWVNMYGHRWPLALISKEDYEWIHQHAKHLTDRNHIIAVVDCAVYPTLSYGWHMSELKGLPFPGLDLILEKDAEFKVNPTNVHNQGVKLIIKEKQAAEAPPVTLGEGAEEEDDFIMDDEDEAENQAEESADEEEEFEFAD